MHIGIFSKKTFLSCLKNTREKDMGALTGTWLVPWCPLLSPWFTRVLYMQRP